MHQLVAVSTAAAASLGGSAASRLAGRALVVGRSIASAQRTAAKSTWPRAGVAAGLASPVVIRHVLPRSTERFNSSVPPGRSNQTPGSRGSRPDAMQHGEAIAKYAIDLTERARLGKLDPVVAREHEIRRTLQVLSRRSKNNPWFVVVCISFFLL